MNAAQTTTTLGGLAAKANDCHWKFHNGCKRLLPYGKAAGDALIAAKEAVGHGNWLEWLRANFDASADTAENYMKVARNWDRLQAALEANPKLSIEEALRRLRDPRAAREAAARPAVRTKVVVELTPGEEARGELRKWFQEYLRRLTDEEAIYTREYGRDLWDALWAEAHAEVYPLARLVVRAEKRCREALQGLEAARGTEGWEEKREEVDAAFRLEILKGLRNLDELTHFQKDDVLTVLGVDLIDFEDRLSPDDVRRIGRGLPCSPTRRWSLVWHLRELVEEHVDDPHC
jgi:hypothetical protein